MRCNRDERRPRNSDGPAIDPRRPGGTGATRSAEHTSELQSRLHIVCRLLLEKKNTEKLNAHIERRVEVWQAISDKLEENQPEILEDDIPEAVMAEDREGALYE